MHVFRNQLIFLLFDWLYSLYHNVSHTGTLSWQKLATPDKCHIKRCFTSKINKVIFIICSNNNLQQKNTSFGISETHSNTVLFSKILCYTIFLRVTQPHNNRPYYSGKGVVKIVQICHRAVQPGIVQKSFLVTGMKLTIPLPIKSQTCSIIYIKVRWLGWPLNGGHVLLLRTCDSACVLFG